MKKKSTSKKIASQTVVRMTTGFVVLLCLSLVGGTTWFFLNTLDALAVAQTIGTSANPPKVTGVNPQQLDKVLKAAADRQSDRNKLPTEYRNPFALLTVPPAAPSAPASAPTPPAAPATPKK